MIRRDSNVLPIVASVRIDGSVCAGDDADCFGDVANFQLHVERAGSIDLSWSSDSCRLLKAGCLYLEPVSSRRNGREDISTVAVGGLGASEIFLRIRKRNLSARTARPCKSVTIPRTDDEPAWAKAMLASAAPGRAR